MTGTETAPKERVLIVDDEDNMRHMLSVLLGRHGYQAATAANGAEALGLMEGSHFDYVLCDVRMPKMDGLGFLRAADPHLDSTTLIMMSAYGTIDMALEAMKAGAYDFITKPFKPDEVLLALKKAREREQLRRENATLRRRIRDLGEVREFGRFITGSPAAREVLALAARVAAYDTTVLITGESGTGKELVARGIHDHSPRAIGPFVAVNCGSIPETLLESEFFGHLKGAFTGADHNRKGLFAEARGGTLLLDEIGELPLALQVKLLRVLQENEIRPVGSTRPVGIDVRVMAATARDLEEEIRAGRFRDDLYFRINVVRVHIPPLRERKEDLPLLCRHFLERFNAKLGREIKEVSPAALALLLRHPWPGNVRELENVMERAMILADGDRLGPEHLPLALGAGNQALSMEGLLDTLSIKQAHRAVEKMLISRALTLTQGNKVQAGKLLEISYPSLLGKIKEFQLEEE